MTGMSHKTLLNNISAEAFDITSSAPSEEGKAASGDPHVDCLTAFSDYPASPILPLDDRTENQLLNPTNQIDNIGIVDNPGRESRCNPIIPVDKADNSHRKRHPKRKSRKAFKDRDFTSTKLKVSQMDKSTDFRPGKKHKVMVTYEGGAKKQSERKPALTVVVKPDGKLKGIYLHRTRKEVKGKMPTITNHELAMLPTMSEQWTNQILYRIDGTRLRDLLDDETAVMFGDMFTLFEWTQKKVQQWKKIKKRHTITPALMKVLVEHKDSFWRPEFEAMGIELLWRTIVKECGDHIQHWLLCCGDETVLEEFNRASIVEAKKVNAAVEVASQRDLKRAS